MAKGMKLLLEERGKKMLSGCMKHSQKHPDFKNEKSMIEHFLVGEGNNPVFLQNFHHEFNPIEFGHN